MKKSLLALAVSLAAASGAHAAWDSGANVDPGVNANGEALLMIVDLVNGRSYAQDLGIKYNDLLTGTPFTGQTIALNTTLLSQVFPSGTANLQWNVVAANSYTANDSDYSLFGFLATGNVGQVPPAGTDAGTFYGNAQNLHINGFLASATSTGLYASAGNDVAIATTATDLKYVGNFSGEFQQNWAAQLGTLGSTQSLYAYGLDGNTFLTTVQTLGTITLSATGVTLNGTSTPEVPVPAAVWLLGSALAGLGGVARGRRKQV